MSRMGHVSRRLLVMAGLVVCVGLATAPAMAASITYDFTGTVTNVDPRFSSQFSEGSTMLGSVIVDTADRASADGLGSYKIENLMVTIGGYPVTLGFSPSAAVLINDNGMSSAGTVDSFTISASGLDGDIAGGLRPRLFSLGLNGPDDIWSSDALPMPVPGLSSFMGPNRFSLFFGGELHFALAGDVTSLTAVPLPASALLFAVGLVTLISLGGRRILQGTQGLITTIV